MCILDFLYHNAIGATLSLCTFLGLEYISDPDHFIERISGYKSSVFVWTVDKVIACKMLYDDHIYPAFIETYENTILDKSGPQCITLGKRQYVPFRITTKDKNTYYRKRETPNDDNARYCPNIISAEIEINNETTDIYEPLKYFFINGNTLDHAFVVDYMNKFHDVEIDDDVEYTINMIDHECNFINCSPLQYIECKEGNIGVHSKIE